MATELYKKIRYVRDRAVNAYWMIRDGRFRLLWKSLLVEIRYRAVHIKNTVSELLRGAPPGEAVGIDKEGGDVVLDSEYDNQVNKVPGSYRPTVSRACNFQLDEGRSSVLARALRDIRVERASPIHGMRVK